MILRASSNFTTLIHTRIYLHLYFYLTRVALIKAKQSKRKNHIDEIRQERKMGENTQYGEERVVSKSVIRY